ncbi:T9SS type B sorting domain-containing protein [Polaribacter sp. MSW13]|uniref:T9SS type B sorting domain-containing protein n=1 Tax=Polaribacter marinus TaxID=2916838 RepID=A0A9X1VNN2_9FLAO|nr:choice-of-anchor L domain-containing protein [Polaribacter marinus]MCI2228923.1 T9SS type B sorting domain-containing protein [Polaribacter marinus]
MIKKIALLIILFAVMFVNAQSITVDSQTYSPQQLIEDVLIGSNCISNVQVTNTVGGNFGANERSYGYFDATGTTFPFQSGIVLSTGRLNNVPGPNNNLSDDDANNWMGDQDLETALQETNTINATIIEFDFTTQANQVSFRYLFASEEYQEGDSNTCRYSDLFGFLIKPASAPVSDYENIALVPDTQTPIKVTTVHSGIPGSCDPINEAYFGGWNDSSYQPINFNGQTTILTATANTTPNVTYHVKLVIADHENYRYDSAVFLEAGSFQLTTDLGVDRLLATNNAICGTESITLNATQAGTPSYKWFKDTVEQTTETESTLNVSETGTYNVEVTLDNGCISYGEIILEYAPLPNVMDTTIIECDANQDGLTTYNLFEATDVIINNDQALSITAFYTSFTDAENGSNPIPNPSNYNNTTAGQIVYASVISQATGCSNIAEIILDISANTLTLQDVNICDDEVVDGFATFNLNDIRTQIELQVPANASITFYTTYADAFDETNVINGNFNNTIQNSQTIFVKVTTDTNQCYAISELTLNVLFTPQLLEDEIILYCLNSFPQTTNLLGGVTNGNPNNFDYQWLFNGTDTGVDTPTFNANQIGVYTVIIAAANGCSKTRTITLLPLNELVIDGLQYTELTTNNTASITISSEGDYEYAIDNEFDFYQDANTFSNLQPGFHTIYVRDKNLCRNTFIEFSILGFPQFFTPNGDHINDVWRPVGTSRDFNANLELLIFNRYGKLLVKTTSLIGWDGTLNGANLPSNDYWYIINHPNGKQYKGHFALLR